MYNKIIGLMLIIGMLFLSSCSLGGSRTALLDNSNDEEIAKARFKEVIEALENQDGDALKMLFSNQSLESSDDFDGSMTDLLGFFNGRIDSWEKLDGNAVFESNDHGHVTKMVSSYYYVTTDNQKYFFLLDDYPVDTDHPENVGIYLLLAVKAEDEEKIWDGEEKILFDGNQKVSHAGIYLPFEYL
ncbi:MAG TPA: DUF5104 domain-containing protein [Anaerovoracaceae bacterium]|nr:DUF5104 domain-containing protein [Anaerovoracaceae bacterium]